MNKTTYSYSEVFQSSLEYFTGNELAAKAFVDKYAMERDGAFLERTPDDLHRRLAKEFARVEAKYPNPMSEEEIYGLFKDFRFVIPQGSPMAGIGNSNQLMSLSNCFVIPNCHDSYGGICYTDQQQVQLMKRRGGVGHGIEGIRPKGLITNNAARTTDGIEVFMVRYSNSTREVAQNGRRGALMLSGLCHHPEIRNFISSKTDLTKITGANISVRWTDEFMRALVNKEEVQLRWPVDSKTPAVSTYVSAESVWSDFVQCAWKSAEPGAFFWDTVLREGPADCYPEFRSTSTNPCGEIPLCPYDSCRLMLLNLCGFITNPFTRDAQFDWEMFHSVAIKAQRLMDDMIDLELECVDAIIEKVEKDEEPLHIKQIELDLWKNIRRTCQNGRRTGLGPTAVGDAVAMLGLRYGSQESIDLVEKFYRGMAIASYRSSVTMAKERGAFPAFKHSIENGHPFITKIVSSDAQLLEDYMKYGRRNIANTTTSPAGTTSLVAMLSNEPRIFGVSSGIEPAYTLHYTRKKKISNDESRVDFIDETGDKWQLFDVYHPGYKLWKDVVGDSKEECPYTNATALDVDWIASVDLQAAAQKWVCHAISKTCNLPKDATPELVDAVYRRAWEKGCKGFTIYRDGCRDGVLTTAGEEPQKTADASTVMQAVKRPEELFCDIRHTTVHGEKWIVLTGLLNDEPYEIFAGPTTFIQLPKRVKKGKIIKYKEKDGSRYDLHYDFDKGEDEVTIIKDVGNIFSDPAQAGFTRMISLSLRHGTPVRFIVEQLTKAGKAESDLFSISKAMSRVLKFYIPDGVVIKGKSCPECSSTNLAYKDGCVQCLDCGFSACS
jgi:ribonucleoside-diphosphate reductase alpha chain